MNMLQDILNQDLDPTETQEWIDALNAVIGADGAERAHYLLERMVDATRLNEATIMPSFYRIHGLNRVAKNLRGKPILGAAEIEDVVAFLMTLKD